MNDDDVILTLSHQSSASYNIFVFIHRNHTIQLNNEKNKGRQIIGRQYTENSLAYIALTQRRYIDIYCRTEDLMKFGLWFLRYVGTKTRLSQYSLDPAQHCTVRHGTVRYGTAPCGTASSVKCDARRRTVPDRIQRKRTLRGYSIVGSVFRFQ